MILKEILHKVIGRNCFFNHLNKGVSNNILLILIKIIIKSHPLIFGDLKAPRTLDDNKDFPLSDP
jgi:hypothetical protein